MTESSLQGVSEEIWSLADVQQAFKLRNVHASKLQNLTKLKAAVEAVPAGVPCR
jgi:hypothetical protein